MGNAGRPNIFSQVCGKCRRVVKAGEGVMRQEYDKGTEYRTGGYDWIVYHIECLGKIRGPER